MKSDLIKGLQSDRSIYAECPCGESFPLHKAVMFYADGPIPPEAQKIIKQTEQDLIERKMDVLKARHNLKSRSETATVSVNIGKIIEKVAPAIRGFKFDRRDCRFLSEPIDYLVFNGLTRQDGLIDSIYFVDIKTGGAGLGFNQRQIRDAVQAGKVTWESYGGRL